MFIFWLTPPRVIVPSHVLGVAHTTPADRGSGSSLLRAPLRSLALLQRAQLTVVSLSIAKVKHVQQRFIGSWQEPGGHVVQCTPPKSVFVLGMPARKNSSNLSFGVTCLSPITLCSSLAVVYLIPRCLNCVRTRSYPRFRFVTAVRHSYSWILATCSRANWRLCCRHSLRTYSITFVHNKIGVFFVVFL